ATGEGVVNTVVHAHDERAHTIDAGQVAKLQESEQRGLAIPQEVPRTGQEQRRATPLEPYTQRNRAREPLPSDSDLPVPQPCREKRRVQRERGGRRCPR